jgi:hypothetical protein
MWTLLSSKELKGERSPLRPSFCGGKKDGGEEVHKLNVRYNSSNLGSKPAIHKIRNKQCDNLS